MAQFDVHEMRSGGPRVVVVQSDLLDPLNTRVVVPLLPRDGALKPLKRLNPIVRIEGSEVIFAAQFVASVPLAELSLSVGNLAADRDEITSALDMLYFGF